MNFNQQNCGECGNGYTDFSDYLCEACRGAKCCGGIGTFGLAPVEDPRFFGGYVDAKGIRHDPMRHKDNCALSRPLDCALSRPLDCANP